MMENNEYQIKEILNRLNKLENAVRLHQKEEFDNDGSIKFNTHMDIVQAAMYLGICRSSLYTLMRTGQLAYVYIGKQRRILVSDMKKYTRKNYVPARTSIV